MNNHNETIEITIDDYSSPIEVFVNEDETIESVFEKFAHLNHTHLPVVSGSVPVGMILYDDLLKLDISTKDKKLRVKDLDLPKPYCVLTGSPMDVVAFDMSQRKIESALVVNKQGELESIFTSVDALNALIEVVRGDYSAAPVHAYAV